jgi:hypothetical protein
MLNKDSVGLYQFDHIYQIILSSNWAACTVKRFSQTSYNISHWGFANSESFSLMIFARAPQFAFSRWQFCLDHFSILFSLFIFSSKYRIGILFILLHTVSLPYLHNLSSTTSFEETFQSDKKHYSRQEQKAWRAIKNYHSIQSNSAITNSVITNSQL